MTQLKIRLNYQVLALTAIPLAVIVFFFANPKHWDIPLGLLVTKTEEASPFLDMRGRLAAMEGFKYGLDIYNKPNPFDPYGRISTKPSYPLHLSKLGFNLDHAIPLGVLTVLTFFALTVISIKPENWIQTLYGIVLICSPPVLLGIERANDDLVLYCLLWPIPWLLSSKHKTFGLLASTVLIILITPVKYYPFALFVLLLYKPLSIKTTSLLFLAGLLAVGGYTLYTLEEFLFLRSRMPNPASIYSFGSKHIFEFLHISKPLAAFLRIGLLTAIISICLYLVFKGKKAATPQDPIKERFFLWGSTMFAFCFILIGNWDYRVIFCLPCIPYLWSTLKNHSIHCDLTANLSRAMLLILPLFFFIEQVGYHLCSQWCTIDNFVDTLRYFAIAKQLLCWALFTLIAMISALILKPSLQDMINDLTKNLGKPNAS
ncbi:MAG: hypothetical protein ACSHYA_06000 [Opitutaceae bacterium]